MVLEWWLENTCWFVCCRQWISNTQFVGLCQHHLQDRHEGGRLAEVAAAHNVCVDVESVGVGAALDAAGHTVQTTDYSWRQLKRRVCVSLKTFQHQQYHYMTVCVHTRSNTHRLLSQLVIEILEPLVSIVQLPLGLLLGRRENLLTLNAGKFGEHANKHVLVAVVIFTMSNNLLNVLFKRSLNK